MEPGVFCSGVSFRKELFTGVRMLFDGIYNGRRVLVTGHAGFKGAWLAAWLVRLGAKVCGISLRPHFEPNHFRLLSLPVQSEWCDIREPGELSTIVGEVRPEIVFHFASQSSPERAWEEPEFTYSVNVMGCVHLLDAVRRTPGCRAVVVALPGGGRSGPDPLAASGRCVAEVLASYRTGEVAVPVVGLRSGILVGGGDWNAGRLLPDLVRAALQRRNAILPAANSGFCCRHVLDFAADALETGRRLLSGEDFTPAVPENSPAPFSVADAVRAAVSAWPELAVETTGGEMSPAGFVTDPVCVPVWNPEEAVARAAAWYRAFHRDGELSTAADLDAYLEAARRNGASWLDGKMESPAAGA